MNKQGLLRRNSDFNNFNPMNLLQNLKTLNVITTSKQNHFLWLLEPGIHKFNISAREGFSLKVWNLSPFSIRMSHETNPWHTFEDLSGLFSVYYLNNRVDIIWIKIEGQSSVPVELWTEINLTNQRLCESFLETYNSLDDIKTDLLNIILSLAFYDNQTSNNLNPGDLFVYTLPATDLTKNGRLSKLIFTIQAPENSSIGGIEIQTQDFSYTNWQTIQDYSYNSLVNNNILYFVLLFADIGDASNLRIRFRNGSNPNIVNIQTRGYLF